MNRVKNSFHVLLCHFRCHFFSIVLVPPDSFVRHLLRFSRILYELFLITWLKHRYNGKAIPRRLTVWRKEERATVTPKLGVAWDHIRSDRVRCGSQPDDGALPSNTRVSQFPNNIKILVTSLPLAIVSCSLSPFKSNCYVKD